MTNGIAGLRPFPTFGGDTAGGITPVTLAPTAPRFPNVSGRTFTTPPRDDINPLAYLAPVGLSFLADKLFSGRAAATPEEELLTTINDINATELERARAREELVFGPQKTQTTGQRIGELVTQYLPALLTDNDKELAAFMTTASAFDKAKTDRDNLTNVNRQNFITEQLKKKSLNFENYIDTESVGAGKSVVERLGVEHPQFGLLINDPDNPNAIQRGPLMGYVKQSDLEGNFVKSGTFDKDRFSVLKNPRMEELAELAKETRAKDALGIDTMLSINSAIETIDDSEGEPLAVLGGILSNFASDVSANLRGLARAAGLDSVFDPIEGTRAANLNKLIEQRKQLVDANQDTTAIDEILLKEALEFEALFKNTNLNFNLFDPNNTEQDAFARVSLLADYIALGYQLAGFRFGQTGRTLSDKDLAFALQSVGFGATQNKEVAKAQLMKVGYQILDAQDLKSLVGFNPYDFNDLERDKTYISSFENFYKPTETKTDAEGNVVLDWDSDISTWEYIDYEKRLERKLGIGKTGKQINPVTQFKQFTSPLYKNPEIPLLEPDLIKTDRELQNILDAFKTE